MSRTRVRVIPSLLLRGSGLVKTVKFASPTYVGDPINAVRIFNEKEVDELCLLDISATREGRGPQVELIAEIAGECFMPLCYGGGIDSLEDIQEIFRVGVEKVALNSKAVEDPTFVRRASQKYGSQSIVVSIDVKRNILGKYQVTTRSGSVNTKLEPRAVATEMQRMGAGELLLYSIDRDGTMEGYDIELIKSVSEVVDIPVIALGGARGTQDFADAVKVGGASAVAAGSIFVFHGKHRAVLINVPSPNEIQAAFQ